MGMGMGGSVRLVTVKGIPIRVHVSWLVVYALLTWSLAVGYFPRVLPELSPVAYWANGLLAAFLLFVTVLLHELSHALVAIAHGLHVRDITLHIFGGVSHLDDEPPSPRAEFLIAVVGPLTSFTIAAVLWVVGAAGFVEWAWARAVLGYLVFINIALGVFNLVPGFPLDGGRLLRAVLWRWQGSLPRATWLASRVGAAFALGFIVLGVFQMLGGSVFGGVWTILIGLFLRSAADASYAQIALREALGRLSVRDIMTRDVFIVRGDATVAEVVDRFWTHHVTSFPVVDDGGVRGIVSLREIRAVPQEQWGRTRVGEVMRPLEADLVIAPQDSVLEALQKASRNGLGRLVVLDDARLAGYLSLKDITHVLALRGLPGEVSTTVEPLPEGPPRPVSRAA